MNNRTNFLFDAASYLYKKFGTDLSKLTIVASSRRTKLFMNKYFAELSGGSPLWAPKYTSIIQLFSNASELNLYDDSIQKISLTHELYNAYKKVLQSKETFDEFYFFGEILLNDFNDIDKAMLNPNQVFRIMSEHKELESFGYLEPEQIELIRKFFKFDKNSVLQKEFFNIWNNLALIYANFKEALLNKKISYEGMLMRSVMENFEIEKFNAEQYVFIGFNQLSKVEKMLMDKLTEKSIKFQDDTDSIEDTKISLIEAANSSMQTGYIKEWLASLGNKNFEDANTAVILCDEKLLPSTLSALPSEIEPNIAILYSLIQSQTASLLISEMEIIAKNYEQAPQNLLKHLLEFLERIANDKTTTKPLEIAALSECYKMLNALNNIMDYMENSGVLIKLIKRLLFSIKISYSGEPAKGLQVMAMSDTRNMDFENILMLSANDGIIPKAASESSFIPGIIRNAFNLPSLAEQEAEEKYNFYRLLKRAKNAAFVYSTGKKGIGKGEMSRYLMQLLVPNNRGITRITLESDIENEQKTEEIVIEKTEDMLSKLKNRKFSPSAFNKYINCSLQFYFEYVAGIKKPNETEEIDAAVMGNIFHRTMELYYEKNESLDALIEQAWKEKTEIGIKKLVFYVIKKMAQNIIDYDKKNPVEIIAREKKCDFEIELKDGTKIKIGGVIDRIDKIGDVIRIVDYKTGSILKPDYLFQISLYSSILCDMDKFQGNKISAAVFFALAIGKNDSSPVVFDDFRPKKDEFINNFKEKLEELFNINIPFSQCQSIDNCKYCDYLGICGRGR